MRDDLERITEEKGFPRYSAFRKAVDLGKRLYKEVSGIDSKSTNLYYVVPGPYIIDDTLDPRRYKIFIDLSSIILSTACMYEKSDAKLNHFKYIDTKKLTEIYPAGAFLEMKEASFDNHLEENIRQLASKCAEMIEDRFYELSFYERRRSNPMMEKYMEKIADQIHDDAALSMEIADIIGGFNVHWLGGEMKGVMGNLADRDRLLSELKRDDHIRSFDDLLKFHAHLYGLDYNANPYAFSNLIGQEVTASMLIARDMLHLKDIGANFNMEKQDSLAVGYKGFIYAQQWDKEVRDSYKKDRISLIGETLLQNGIIENHFKTIKSPFSGLADRLHSLGIPSREAVAISNYLSFNFLERQHSKKEKHIDEEEIFDMLQKEDDSYASALHAFMHKAIGKKPNTFIYKYFDPGEISQADAIEALVYAVERKEGKNLIRSETWTRFGPDLGFEKAIQQLGMPEIDIYVGVNSGVCFIHGDDIEGFVKRPLQSIIEVRNVNPDLKASKPLAYNLQKKQVDFHEVVHAMQVDTRLLWRNLALHVAHFFLDLAISQKEIGRLDSIYPFQRLRRYSKKTHTWRDEILDDIELYTRAALGEGALAEEMRHEGIYNAAYRNGLRIGENGSLSLKHLRKEVPLERSRSAQLVGKVKKTILDGTIEDMLALEEVLLDKISEMDGLVETMAESFSIDAAKLYLDNYPDKRYGEKMKKASFESLLKRAEFRGKQAVIFLDIADNNPKDMWQDLLKEKGMKYEQFIKKEGIGHVSEELRGLGYDPIFPEEAYDDMSKLEEKVASAGKALEDYLTPINSAYALIGERYEKNTGKVFALIKKHGTKEAFNIMADAESFSDITKFLNKPLKS